MNETEVENPPNVAASSLEKGQNKRKVERHSYKGNLKQQGAGTLLLRLRISVHSIPQQKVGAGKTQSRFKRGRGQVQNVLRCTT